MIFPGLSPTICLPVREAVAQCTKCSCFRTSAYRRNVLQDRQTANSGVVLSQRIGLSAVQVNSGLQAPAVGTGWFVTQHP